MAASAGLAVSLGCSSVESRAMVVQLMLRRKIHRRTLVFGFRQYVDSHWRMAPARGVPCGICREQIWFLWMSIVTFSGGDAGALLLVCAPNAEELLPLCAAEKEIIVRAVVFCCWSCSGPCWSDESTAVVTPRGFETPTFRGPR